MSRVKKQKTLKKTSEREGEKLNFTLRTPDLEKVYSEFRKNTDPNYCPFCNRDLMRHEFKYWIVVDNRFPYNKAFVTHHLLAAKRHVRTWEELTREEFEELKSIEYQVMNKEFGDYDVIIINVPARQSVPRHLHFHLAAYKK